MKEQLALIGVEALKVLLPFVGLLVSALAMRGLTWLQAHTKSLQVKTLEQHLFNIAQVAVGDVFHAVQADIGKLSATDLAKMKQDAINTVKLHLGTQGLLDIKNTLAGDVEAIISSHVGHAINEAKGA